MLCKETFVVLRGVSLNSYHRDRIHQRYCPGYETGGLSRWRCESRGVRGGGDGSCLCGGDVRRIILQPTAWARRGPHTMVRRLVSPPATHTNMYTTGSIVLIFGSYLNITLGLNTIHWRSNMGNPGIHPPGPRHGCSTTKSRSVSLNLVSLGPRTREVMHRRLFYSCSYRFHLSGDDRRNSHVKGS